jgi:hypothetical protein
MRSFSSTAGGSESSLPSLEVLQGARDSGLQIQSCNGSGG